MKKEPLIWAPHINTACPMEFARLKLVAHIRAGFRRMKEKQKK